MFAKNLSTTFVGLLLAACSNAYPPADNTQKHSANIPSPGVGISVCPQDAKMCPDGSFVTRNSRNNCQFDPCGK